MNSALSQAYSAYMPKPKKKLKRKNKDKPPKGDTSANLPPRRPQRLPPKEAQDLQIPRTGKSAEPQRLPKLPRLQSRTPEPTHMTKPASIDRNTSSSVDITLDKLEKLQFKSITARSEWLSVQERKFALHLLNRNFIDSSLDEMDEMLFDNKYEVLMNRYETKAEPKLPPLRRQSPG